MINYFSCPDRGAAAQRNPRACANNAVGGDLRQNATSFKEIQVERMEIVLVCHSNTFLFLCVLPWCVSPWWSSG